MSLILKVSTAKISKNIVSIKNKIGSAKFCAVVKANAYGIGIEIVKYIDNLVDYYAVSSVFEANQLIAFTKKPIVVLSPPSLEEIKDINSHQIEFAVDSLNTIKKLSKINKSFKIHIAVNTGMNRFGVTDENFVKILKQIALSKNIQLEGIFSHFWGEDNLSQENQNSKFKKFCKTAKYYFPNLICHIANTSGTKFSHDMVRVGIGLYSCNNFDCIKMQSQIATIQHLKVGDIAGYGAKFVAKRPAKIAIVKAGYGDGISRDMVGYSVLVCGKLCKIVAVCMDAILVDITHTQAKTGDIVIVSSPNKKQTSICFLAKHCDTISYEILTRLTKRVIREYER